MAEGVGFEPTRGISPPKRLAGARTRPLCDPSNGISCQYSRDSIADATQLLYEYSTRGRNSGNSCPRLPASFPSPSRHSHLASYSPTVIPITITSFPPRILPPAVIPITITSFPPRILPLSASFPPPSRHSRLSSYSPAVIPITITSFPPLILPPTVIPATITSFPPLILHPRRRHSHHHHVIPASHPTSRRHSHHHHVIPAKAGIQRPASDDALVEPHVVARLSARATILTCARWRDTTTLSSTGGRFSFSKRDLPVRAAPDRCHDDLCDIPDDELNE